jgi:hypothetical protein
LLGAHREQRSDDHRYIKKAVNVQRVDQVLDVITPLPDVERLQDEGEKRDATKHHHRDVAPHRLHEKLGPLAAFPDFFFDLALQPGFERGFVAIVRADGEMEFILFLWLRRNADGWGGRRRMRSRRWMCSSR